MNLGEELAAARAERLSVFPLEISLEKRRLWSRLRIDGKNVRRALQWFQLVDALAATARKLLRPIATFQILPVEDVLDASIRLGGGIWLEGLGSADLFQDADEVALCALTLGPELERLANQLAMAGDYAEASVLSMIGDVAVVEGQGRLRRLAESAANVNRGPEAALVAGPMVQPGSDHWVIQGNATFARHVALAELGVEVLESFALNPLKSKTFACPLVRRKPRWAEG